MGAVSETRGGICRIAFGIGEDPLDGLPEAVDAAVADGAVRAIVLSGFDRRFLADPTPAEVERRRALDAAGHGLDQARLAALLARLDACAKPLVARIEGVASGLGVGLVAVTDVAVAAEDAEFSVPDVRHGLVPEAVVPCLVRSVGHRQARRLLLSGDRIRGPEAKAVGLVHEVVPRAQLDAGVDRMLVGLMKADPATLVAVKAALRAADRA